MTNSRLSSGKSISISGIVIRSIFKKRSNNKLYFKGSTSVIPKEKLTKLPQALPRPGPTKILLFLAYFIKS